MTTLILSADHFHDGQAMAAAGTVLVVSAGRVAEVTTVIQAAKRHSGATREHFAGATIVPGLIDLHAYLSVDPDKPDPMRQTFGLNHFERAWVSARHLRRNLAAGITTLRVMGEGHSHDFAARDALRAGLLTGSDLGTSGVPIAPIRTAPLRADGRGARPLLRLGAFRAAHGRGHRGARHAHGRGLRCPAQGFQLDLRFCGTTTRSSPCCRTAH